MLNPALIDYSFCHGEGFSPKQFFKIAQIRRCERSEAIFNYYLIMRGIACIHQKL
jgi:hypothetical protein